MNRKTVIITVVGSFLISLLISLNALSGTEEKTLGFGPRQLGQLCIAQIYPEAGRQIREEINAVNRESVQAMESAAASAVSSRDDKEEKEADNSNPQVIIYHTHSSESYQPYTASNFHRQEEEGTVREVGNVMTEELNRLGIGVVHNRTVHDSPSYNQSYERSLETVTSLLEEYPSAEIVIDLHRDAAAYTGNVGETMEINGETVAEYKLVVGQANGNYSSLMDFAGEVNEKADELYPGFAGRILEKEYNYNEYIADKYLLLEVGNNQNDIEDVKRTGKYFAHVIAEVLEE